MFARLVELTTYQTCDELYEDYCPDYKDGVDDGQTILARAFLDEAVIVRD